MADLWERRRILRDRQREARLQETRLQDRIRREGLPTYGTDGMWRHQSYILLATVALLTDSLSAPSVVVVADARYTLVDAPQWDMYTRLTWVDLPDGTCWEPVECTLLPRDRHHELSAPRALWRYPGKAKLKAAIHRADQLPVSTGEGTIRTYAPAKWDYLSSPLGLSSAEFLVRLNRLINGGIPDGGLELGE